MRAGASPSCSGSSSSSSARSTGASSTWNWPLDYEGAVLLIVLGVAMAFGFTVLLRGSREL